MNSKRHHPKNKAERIRLKALHEMHPKDALVSEQYRIRKDTSNELRPEGVDEEE